MKSPLLQPSIQATNRKAPPSGRSVSFSDLTRYPHAKEINEDSLVICMDEVSKLFPGLMEKKNDDHTDPSACPYRCFRRVAKQRGVLSIMADTYAKISRLAAQNDHSSQPNQLGIFIPSLPWGRLTFMD